MKLWQLAGSLLLGAAAITGCDKEKVVTVYMYSEYHDPAMREDFEKRTGYKLKIEEYESSEGMLAKMQQGGGVSQYDCIVVSDAHVPALIKLGLVQKLDKSKLPNAGNVEEAFANPAFDPGAAYSLPYQWGTVGLMYDSRKVPGELSWDLIFDPDKQPGAFVLMDSMRDMIGLALHYKGHDMNSVKPEEVKVAMELLKTTKKSRKCLGLEGGVGGKNRVQSGEAALAVVYNGDAIRAVAENKDLRFGVPKEGGIIWVDVMLVPTKAPSAEGAHAFINYIMSPEAGATLSNYNRYPTPNKAAMPLITPADLKEEAIYPSEEVKKKLHYLKDLKDIGNSIKLFDDAWTSVKAE
jgi:spermidine/putrescine transport system substrate-binding protein